MISMEERTTELPVRLQPTTRGQPHIQALFTDAGSGSQVTFDSGTFDVPPAL